MSRICWQNGGQSRNSTLDEFLNSTGDPIQESLIQEFHVKGVPTIVFLDREGIERRNLRVVNYVSADQFLGRFSDVTRSATP